MIVSRNMMWGLLALAASAGLAAVLLPPARNRWMNRGTSDESDRVDEASEDSFPASDPPSQSVPSAATTGPVS
jgi:hypothetical protein